MLAAGSASTLDGVALDTVVASRSGRSHDKAPKGALRKRSSCSAPCDSEAGTARLHTYPGDALGSIVVLTPLRSSHHWKLGAGTRIDMPRLWRWTAAPARRSGRSHDKAPKGARRKRSSCSAPCDSAPVL